MNKKCLAGLLQGQNRRALPTKSTILIAEACISSHVKRNLAHLLRVSELVDLQRRDVNKDGTYDTRKGKPSQEQIRALLILPNLAKGDSARSVPPLFWLGPTRRGISACVGREYQRQRQRFMQNISTRQCTRMNASLQFHLKEKNTTYAALMAPHEAHHHHHHCHHHHRRRRRRRRHQVVFGSVLVRQWTCAPFVLERP